MYKDGQTQIKACKGSFKKYVVERGEGVIEKRTKTSKGEGGMVLACVRSLFLKQMLTFSKLSFIVILQFFLLIIMAV